MSPDQRQALCYQCHAPVATMQVGSGDDRTGIGVHEGISCLACHRAARPKDAGFVRHLPPQDVELRPGRGEDGYHVRSPGSKHNIHWVKCADCHTKGVPRKKTQAAD